MESLYEFQPRNIQKYEKKHHMDKAEFTFLHPIIPYYAYDEQSKK